MADFRCAAAVLIVVLSANVEAFKPRSATHCFRSRAISFEYASNRRRNGVVAASAASALSLSGDDPDEGSLSPFSQAPTAGADVPNRNKSSSDEMRMGKGGDSAPSQVSVKVVERDLARNTFTYDVNLPLRAVATKEQQLGVTLRQMEKGGRLSDFLLDVDSLQYMYVDIALKQAVLSDTTDEKGMENADSVEYQQQLFDKGTRGSRSTEERNPDLQGVIVSSVSKTGLAWDAGVRAGDMLVATSATLGEKVWPKSTLDGVKSALSSRKVMSNRPYASFRFRRSREQIESSQVVETFELSLTRPIGINIEDAENGQVVITSFTDEPLSLAETVLREGDRIVAVDSSLGAQMWPVSNVEGILSAVTSRLPGKPVRIRFERVVEVGEWAEEDTMASSDSVSPALAGAVDGFRRLKEEASVTRTGVAADTAIIPFTGSKTHKLLLARCRDIMRRYGAISTEKQGRDAYANSILVMAADRVLEALADASAPLDALTLAMIMTAYSKCRKPDKAIRAFEAAVGLSYDGSSDSPTVASIRGKKNPSGRIQQDLSALSLYTATSLLRAHALKGDFHAAVRVLAAMEGRTLVVGGKAAKPWPVKLTPDVRSYNVVLAATAKAGGDEAIKTAVDIFESMTDSKTGLVGSNGRNTASTIPWRNLVTYNTLINAFAKAGRSQDAYTVFYTMKQAGIKPDKISYTTLIKSLAEAGDVEGARDLLKDMTSGGVEADVLTYNTVIKGLCKRLKWYEAKELAADMESAGISPDSVTYGLLMNGLLKVGKPSACLTLFEVACTDERTTELTASVQLYTTAISAASTLGDHERALELVSRMKKVGLKPNLKTLTALMNACLRAGKSDVALVIFQQIQKSGAKENVDGLALTLGLRAYCSEGDFSAASKILTSQRDGYQEMSGKDVMSSYNFLLTSALKRENFDVARAALEEMLLSGYIPSKLTLKAILEGLELTPGNRNAGLDAAGPDGEKKFDFLLFVLDSLSKRKLSCDALFYSTILFEGGRLGGSRRYISYLVSKARMEGAKRTGGDDGGEEIKWEELAGLKTGEIRRRQGLSQLPTVRVQVNARDTRQVLAAEQAASIIQRRRRPNSAKLMSQ